MTDLNEISSLLAKTKVQQLNEVNFSNKSLKLDNAEDGNTAFCEYIYTLI